MKKSINPNPRPELKPWHGSRTEDFNLMVTGNLVMICNLLRVSPAKLLCDFINTLSMGLPDQNKELHAQLVNYFITRGYGQQHYSAEEIKKMFEELGAITNLWPNDGNEKVVDKHIEWRRMYHEYWFVKWQERGARRLVKAPQ